MKKLVKSLSVFAFLFALVFVLLASVKAAPVLTVEDGASIRTTGEKQGIRFTASLDDLQGVTERGFLIAKGEYSVEEMQEVGKKYDVSGKTYNMFSAVIYGIPEEGYTQDLTVVAYYVTDGDPVYADVAITRNIAEVAVEAKNNGNETSLVESISSNIYENYKKVFTDKIGNYYVDSAIYESNYEKIAEQFVNDWETKFPGSDITNYTASLKSNLADNDSVFDKECKLYQFFNDEVYGPKWQWLLKYIDSVTVKNDALTAQIKVVLGESTSIGDATWYYGYSIISRLGGFFTQGYYSAGTAGLDFANYPTYYRSILEYNKTVYADLSDTTLVKVGSSIELPAAVGVSEGYTWNGWFNGNENLVAESQYVVTDTNLMLSPNITANEYKIKFYDSSVELTDLEVTFTVEKEVVLPEYEKYGYNFLGWYESPTFEGDPITVIPQGIAKNYVLYANTKVNSALRVTYELNDGSFEYETFDDMVADFINDYNVFAKSDLTTPAAYYKHGSYVTFWKNEDVRAKWLWMWNHIRTFENINKDNQYIDVILAGTSGSYSGYALQNIALYLLRINSSIWVSDYQSTYGSLASKNQVGDFTTMDLNSFRKYQSGAINENLYEEFSAGSQFTLPTVVYKEGYTFGGWYDNAEFNGEKLLTVNESTTVYAKWIAN